jgi:hypothetical protein
MRHRLSSFTGRATLLGVGVILLLASLAPTCRERRDARDIDVASKTTYTGTINGSPIKVDVSATINTGRGGSSSCTFVELPSGFNPAVLGTMA